MKLFLLTFCILTQSILLSQEICDNGIDDDSDGLIDYQDTADCSCKIELDTTFKLMLNSSFEDTNCCPTNTLGGQLNCAKNWVQASLTTSDYLNTCGVIQVNAPGMSPPPTPLPHGNGYIGFFNGAAASQLNYSNYKEYVASCLTDTLFAGTPYKLSFKIAHGKGYLTTTVAIFGSNDCNYFPFGVSPFYQGCPSKGPNFVALDSVTITTSGSIWNTVTFNFIPPYDITTLTIGPNCERMLGNNYYYMDGLKLSKSTSEPYAFISDTGSFCEETIRLFAKSDSMPLSFQWYKDSIAIVGETDSTYKLPSKETGTYQVRVTYSSGCIFTKSFVIKGLPFPVANFTADSVCVGLPTSFTDISSISSGAITQWKWNFTGGSVIQNPSYTFPTSGVFPINLEVKSDSGCIHDTTLMVVVHPKPTASFNYSPTQIYLLNPNVCFTNTSANATTYQWNFGFAGAGNTSSLNSPCPITFPNHTEGTYLVKLIAINQFGCVDSVTMNITLLKGNVLFIPNSFTPNEDNLNDIFLPIMEGIDQYNLIIFNRWGENLFETTDQAQGWNGKHKTITVQQGIYIYRITTKNKSGEVNEITGHINLIR